MYSMAIAIFPGICNNTNTFNGAGRKQSPAPPPRQKEENMNTKDREELLTMLDAIIADEEKRKRLTAWYVALRKKYGAGDSPALNLLNGLRQ